MKKKLLASLSVLVIMGLSLIVGVSAYRGDSTVTSPYYDEATHEAIEAAIEAGDYQTWKTLREEAGLPARGLMFSVINEENFADYQALHEANMAGDEAGAQTVKASLGLGLGQGQGKGQDRRMKSSQAEFIDSDGDGLCDNGGASQGQGKGQGRNQ